VSTAFFPNFTQNLMLILCSKNRTLIFPTNVETYTSYQRQNFHITGVNMLKLYLVQVETCTDTFVLRLSRTIKSFRELHRLPK